MKSVDRLTEAINEKIEYFRMEYDLTYAEVVGALELIKADIIAEARESRDGNDDDT